MKSLSMFPVLAVMGVVAHGAVTLDEGQVLELNAANVGDADKAEITLNGGTLRFSGDGNLSYAGTVNGNGTVEKSGAGYARFENAGVIGSGSVVDVQAGALEVGAFSGEMRVADGATLNVGHRSVRAKALRLSFQKNSWTSNSWDSAQVCLSEVDLYLHGRRLPWPNGVVAETTETLNDNSDPQFLIDRQDDELGKRYNNRMTKPVTFTFSEQIVLDGYSLWSGPRCINGYWGSTDDMNYFCHPISWKMEYSPDGTNWFIFDQQVDNCTLIGKDGGVMTFVPGYGGTSMPSDSDDAKNKSGYAQFYNAEFYKFRNPVSGVSGSDAAVIMNGEDSVLNIDLKSAKIGYVSGSGSVFLDGNSSLTVCGGGNGFNGEIKGGKFVKAGNASQTIGGNVKCDDISVDGGILDFDDVLLNGETNNITLHSDRRVRAKKLRLSFQKMTGLAALSYGVQLSEMDLYLDGFRVPWPNGTVATASRISVSGATAGSLMDRQGDNLNNNYFNAANATVEFTFPQEIEIDGYSLWSAATCINGLWENDTDVSNFRHPISWTLEYQTDDSGWKVFDQQVDNLTLLGKDGGEMTIDPGPNGTIMPSYNAEAKVKAGQTQYYRAEFYKFRNSEDPETVGGVLTGTAQTSGDLNVFTEGGAYGATINVGGVLTIAGKDVFKLFVGDGTEQMKQTSFVFGECDATSRDAYRAAELSADLARGLVYEVSSGENEMSFKLRHKGFVVIIK